MEMAKKLVRLSESELKGLVSRTTQRILKEGNEIKYAQKELHGMGNAMSSVCLRLQGTRYEPLCKKMKDDIVELNNALIKDIRGER